METTVADYQKCFEIASVPSLGAIEDVLEMTFLKGLHLAIKVEVISRRDVGLDEIVREAHWWGIEI